MNRVARTYPVKLDYRLKQSFVHWAKDYDHFAWLDSNNYKESLGSYQAILAVGAMSEFCMDYSGAFDGLKSYRNEINDWLFGYLGYDLKNDIEGLESENHDGLGFPDIRFYQPERLVLIQSESITFLYPDDIEQEIQIDFNKILKNKELYKNKSINLNGVSMHLRTSKDSYFKKLAQVQHHIERGDIYEVNFCQEFFAEDVTIDPVSTFFHLNALSRPPFASLLKLSTHYILSASPERYLRKQGLKVWSQPIKGTAGRESDLEADMHIARQLAADPKERSENIMITDLVRNDLSRIAKKGTVHVDELCEVYTFEQVHQLISTVSCEVAPHTDPVEIIRATFPMGSMTGAPKVSAMKIIEELEDAKRGVYSGAIGYIDAAGDLDFNVVIRSILYNATRHYLSYSVGGAITAASIPEKEYQECLIKAKSLREVLERNTPSYKPA